MGIPDADAVVWVMFGIGWALIPAVLLAVAQPWGRR
jgi:hypothetical protein